MYRRAIPVTGTTDVYSSEYRAHQVPATGLVPMEYGAKNTKKWKKHQKVVKHQQVVKTTKTSSTLCRGKILSSSLAGWTTGRMGAFNQ